MALPFTHDQFLDVFQNYNEAVGGVAIVFWLASAAAAVALFRGLRLAPRLTFLLLSLQWAWAGVAYHLAFFSRVNPAANLFGVAFLLQALLLLRPHPHSPGGLLLVRVLGLDGR